MRDTMLPKLAFRQLDEWVVPDAGRHVVEAALV
jgi:hypothetical protein